MSYHIIPANENLYNGVVLNPAHQCGQGRRGLVCPGLRQLGQVIEPNGDADEDRRIDQD